MSVRALFVSSLLLIVTSCSGEPSTGTDASVRADAGPTGPLPRPGELLDPARYDCRASGPVQAPSRPHDLSCFRSPGCLSPLVVGHRMATAFAPENSASALRAAILLGIDIVETDVRLTSDGHIVLVHDSSIDRTHTRRGTVSALSLAELKEIPLEIPASKSFGEFDCERTLTLEEAFAISRGQIVLELEVKNTEAGVKAAEYLKDQGLYGEAFILCSPAECSTVRAAVPDAPIMTRPQQPDEIPENLAFDPKPIMVHIDPTEDFLAPEALGAIRAAGAKVFANAFILGDPRAALTDDLGGYTELFEGGIDVLQAEHPEWVLITLGRRPE